MKRVVITGLGAVTPIGNDVDSFWNNVVNGECGIDYISRFDTDNYTVKVAAEVKDFDPRQYMDRKEAKRMQKFSQFAVAAAKQAIKSADINIDEIDENRLGVVVGSGMGSLDLIEDETVKVKEKGPNRITPLFIPRVISNMAAGNIAIGIGAKGVCINVVTACSTGTHCIGEAFKMIQCGRADAIIAGGTESTITPLSVAGFTALTALSTSDDPKTASRPFDVNRDGFVIGEGAGIVILESLEHAQKRGANILAELVGYGTTCDAYHMTAPSEDGDGSARAMEIAIKDANIGLEDIEYINAHGTSTPINDKVETNAIKKLFGPLAYKIPISSTKSMTGHLLGAAGAVETIVCVKALQNDYIPATIGFSESDPLCDLDYVPNEGRDKKMNYVLSNSMGFGGHNATLVLKRWDE